MTRIFRNLWFFGLLLAFAPGLSAQVAVNLAPVAEQQFLNSIGAPLANGCVWTYSAGSTTPLATYVDSTGTSQNPNPILLNAAGRASIWLANASYKFVVFSTGGTNCATGTQQWSADNITAPGFGGGGGGTFYQTVDANGTAQTQRPALNFINGANMTISCADNSGSSRSDCTFTSSSTGATAWSAITAATNSNPGTFAQSGNTWDFTAAAALLVKVGAGYAPTTSGSIGYDSTANKWVFGQNTATVSFGLSSAACGANSWVSTPATATATASCSQPGFGDLSGSIALAQTPLTTLGDILSVNSTPVLARVAGNTAATKNFLTQTGNGTVSALPVWGTIAAGDVPTLNQNTTGTAANLTGCTPSTAGSICYWNGSGWTLLAGNTTTTNWLQETSTGVPSWTTPGGSGTVTTTGTPASGNLTKFSGATSITNGDLAGDVTTGGTLTTTLANIPTGVPMAGSVLATEITAPATPAAGKDSLYTDSTDLRFHDKNSSGTIGTTVVSDTGASHNFLTAISAAGAISKAQPAISDLTATFSSPLSLSTNTLSCPTCVTSAASLTANQLVIGSGSQGSQTLGSLGTTTTLLHGNAAGNPSFGSVVSNDLNITTTSCTNQVVTAISAAAAGTCTTATSAYVDSSVVTDSGNTTTTAAKVAISTTTAGKINYIDFPDFHYFPAANCVNAVAGVGWSTGATPAGACRAGTNNLEGYLTWGASDTAQFSISLPNDWDTGTAPSVRLHLASTDTTSGHTIIMQIATACAAGNGTGTDDVAFNTAQSFGTVTLNTTANQEWSTTLSNITMTGCAAGNLLRLKLSRTTDTATNVRIYGFGITIPRLLTVQAN